MRKTLAAGDGPRPHSIYGWSVNLSAAIVISAIRISNSTCKNMVALDAAAVHIGGNPPNKTEAICQVGALLVTSGHIEPGYIESMLARELVATTFLGNGIAVPHGLAEDCGMIRQTGVAVLQVPSGVEWNPGEKAHLVVGIAAKFDEHLDILSKVTDVLSDADEADRLARTHDARDIAIRLSS